MTDNVLNRSGSRFVGGEVRYPDSSFLPWLCCTITSMTIDTVPIILGHRDWVQRQQKTVVNTLLFSVWIKSKSEHSPHFILGSWLRTGVGKTKSNFEENSNAVDTPPVSQTYTHTFLYHKLILGGKLSESSLFLDILSRNLIFSLSFTLRSHYTWGEGSFGHCEVLSLSFYRTPSYST